LGSEATPGRKTRSVSGTGRRAPPRGPRPFSGEPRPMANDVGRGGRTYRLQNTGGATRV